MRICPIASSCTSIVIAEVDLYHLVHSWQYSRHCLKLFIWWLICLLLPLACKLFSFFIKKNFFHIRHTFTKSLILQLFLQYIYSPSSVRHFPPFLHPQTIHCKNQQSTSRHQLSLTYETRLIHAGPPSRTGISLGWTPPWKGRHRRWVCLSQAHRTVLPWLHRIVIRILATYRLQNGVSMTHCYLYNSVLIHDLFV